MSDWDQYFDQQYYHAQYHTENPYLAYQAIQQRYPDYSCHLCFPDRHEHDDTWERFRNWFGQHFPIHRHNGVTRELWDYLWASQRHPNDPWYLAIFFRLLFTLQYTQFPPAPGHVVQVVRDAFFLYQGFAVDPADLDNPQEEDARTRRNLDSKEEVGQTDAATDGSEAESDEGNPPPAQPLPPPRRPLPLPPPVQPLPAMGQWQPNDIQDLLTRLDTIGQKRQPLSIKKFRGYSQDPAEWATEFDSAADELGWNAVTKFQVAPSYLKDAAAAWYRTEQANNPGRIA